MQRAPGFERLRSGRHSNRCQPLINVTLKLIVLEPLTALNEYRPARLKVSVVLVPDVEILDDPPLGALSCVQVAARELVSAMLVESVDSVLP